VRGKNNVPFCLTFDKNDALEFEQMQINLSLAVFDRILVLDKTKIAVA